MGIGNIAKAAATGGLSLVTDKLFGGGNGGAPQVDPRLGANAGRMSGIAGDSYAWNLGEANRLQPMFRELTGQARGISSEAADRSGRIGQQYDSVFSPVNAQVASDAMNYDSPAEMERAAGQALSDTNTAFGQARGRTGAYFGKYGLNPANFASQNFLLNLEQAKAGAGGMNAARENRRMGGIQLRTGAANLGRGILSDATSQSGLALTGGNAAGDLATGGMNVYNAGTSAALPWFTGANNAFLGKQSSDMAGYAADQQANATKWGGIGSLVGTGAGFMMGGPVGAMAGGQAGRGIGSMVAPQMAPATFG